MSFDDAAVRQAISDVVTGAIAGVRAMGTGNASDDIAVGAPVATASQRSAVLPRFTIVVEYAPHEARPQQPSTLWLEAVNVTVEFTSLLPSQALARADYEAVKATDAATAHSMRSSFAWPGKLTTTDAGSATGIVSGVLAWVSSEVVKDAPAVEGTDGGGLYVTSHRFTGTIRATVATT